VNWVGVARCRVRLLRNQLFATRAKSRGAGSRQRPLLGAMLAAALASLICMGLAGLFGQLAAEGAGAMESASALGLVLTAAIAGLLVFDLHEAVSTLVTDSDLELLRRAPISGPALFLIKLADVFPRTSLLVLVLAIPAVVAFHVFYPLPLWGWLLLPFQLFALWAIPLGFGMGIAMLVLRRVPPRRAREVLGLLSTVTLFALWLLNSFLVPRLAAPEGDPMEHLRHALAQASHSMTWSPGHWAAIAIGRAVRGEAPEAVLWTLLLVAGSAIVLGAAALVAANQLESTQIALSVSLRKRRATRDSRGAVGGSARGVDERGKTIRGAHHVTPPASGGSMATAPSDAASPGSHSRIVRAVLVRDARLFFRDWTLLGDVITAAVLWTLLPLVGAPLYHASAAALGRAMLIALTVGLGYEVAARAIPFERHGWAWIRLAPVRRSRWITAKLAGAAALSLPLVALASASMVLTLDIGAHALLEAFVVVVPALALSLSVGLWTGAAFANPTWTNPRGMLTPTGRIVATLLLLVQAGAWLALAAAIDARLVAPRPFALALPLIVAAALAAWPLRATARLLARREWRS
jgi:ABC-2 type transport system permease protein